MLHLISLICFSRAGFTYPVCTPRNTIAKHLSAVNRNVLKVVQVDDADRRTAEEYGTMKNSNASEVEQHYAATGDMKCGDRSSQANLMLVGDAVAVAGHSGAPPFCLKPGGDRRKCCVKPDSYNKCKITFTLEGKKETYDVQGLMQSGWPCPGHDKNETGTDWSLLRLKKKVDPRIKPYDFDPNVSETMYGEVPITVVAKSSDFPSNDKKTQLAERPRHYGDCLNKSTANFDFSESGLMNCDVSPGSSGGGVFKRQNSISPEHPPVLVGIVASINDGTGNKCPPGDSNRIQGDFSNKCFNTRSTLITGDFRDALLNLKKAETPNLSQPESTPQPSTNDRKSHFQDL